jgi:hypothetical protein
MIADVDFRLFLITAPNGKCVRAGVWNGQRNQPPNELLDLVGGKRMYLVQVGRPTNGFEGCSSVGLTRTIAEMGESVSVVHWARDTKTFRSIVAELSSNGTDLLALERLGVTPSAAKARNHT